MSDRAACFTGNTTTQTISPGSASHIALAYVCGYPVLVKMGVIEGETYDQTLLRLNPTHKPKLGDLRYPGAIQLHRHIHGKLGRRQDRRVGYWTGYRACLARMAQFGLLRVEYDWTRDGNDEHYAYGYRPADAAPELLMPRFYPTPLGDEALAILETGAFYVLGYRHVA